MPRFNVPRQGADKTLNYEGAVAFKLDPKTELYTAVCCASLQPKFYEPDVEAQLIHLRNLIQKVPAEFTAKLAVYAREEMYLRSVPLVLTVELAKVHQGDSLISRLTERVIQRADELTEILAYYQKANVREGTKKLGKLSKQLQLGIARAFGKFEVYHFSKYNRQTEVKLRDALFLSHPKPENEERRELYKQIAEDSLPVPYIWETRLSEAGQKGEDKKAIWEELIDSKKVGYMATLRNLRNILQAEVSTDHLERVGNYIANEKAVLNSRQLPFRFLSAYRELKEVPSPYTGFLQEKLEEAIAISAQNIKGFGLDATVLIACDVSASMQCPISPRSAVQNFDIGLVLGMLLQSQCKSVIAGMFGNDWKVIQLPPSRILANADEFHRREGEVGYSTNGWKIIQWLIDQNTEYAYRQDTVKVVDKIMVFTDCQLWDSTDSGYNTGLSQLWTEYKRIAPQARLYLFDLAGYGNTPLSIRQNGVFLIAGWSSKIFNVLNAIEEGKTALSKIENIEI